MCQIHNDFKAVLLRLVHQDRQTLGELRFYQGTKCIFSSKALELPDRDNQRSVSRIDEGPYEVEVRWSEKYKHHYILKDVEGRSYILIHPGNYYTHTRGCILVGANFKDINKDGYNDVTSSKATMAELLAAAPDCFTLEIVDL